MFHLIKLIDFVWVFSQNGIERWLFNFNLIFFWELFEKFQHQKVMNDGSDKQIFNTF